MLNYLPREGRHQRLAVVECACNILLLLVHNSVTITIEICVVRCPRITRQFLAEDRQAFVPCKAFACFKRLLQLVCCLVLQDPPTLPSAQESSPELLDILAGCLAMDPRQRPRAEQLLSHPFLVKYGQQQQQQLQGGLNSSSSSQTAGGAEAKTFMRSMFDPIEK